MLNKTEIILICISFISIIIYAGSTSVESLSTKNEAMQVQNEALGNGLGDLTYSEALLCEDIARGHNNLQDAVVEARANGLVCHWEY
jgi:hypothetical protein